MTKWKGFYKESRNYMRGYSKQYFWSRYPKAWLSFHLQWLGDVLRGLIVTVLGNDA